MSKKSKSKSTPVAVEDQPCVFCMIVSGDLASRTIYEDDHALAFLDIAAWHRGHSLVVTKRHVPDLVSGSPSLLEVAPAVDHVARMLKHRLAADGVNVFSSAGVVAGQTVFHMHIHVVPRYADEPGLDRLVNPVAMPEGELDSVYRQLQAGA